MTEQDLGKALLQRDAGDSTTPNAHEQAMKTLRRHRRWVWVLAGLAIFFWLVAAAGAFFSYFSFMVFVWPRLSEMLTNPSEPSNPEGWRACHRFMVDVNVPLVASAAILMALAALCTVLLVFFSRRVTLRQINLSLAEISKQLAHLQKSS